MNAQLLPATPAHDRILRIAAVAARVSLSRATIHRRVASGEFPAPVSLGGNAVGWRESQISEWLASRQAVRS